MSLPVLPYDLLFHIAQYLDIDDIHSLQATCKSLRSFTLTRPVYRSLAHALLCRSRPLPLPAFRRLADVSTQNLIRAVDRAHTFEKAWRVRAPRPARSSPFLEYFGHGKPQSRWYIKISAPPNEEIDWLSPITASYTLCATKSGRVVCWDVARDVCLAEWDPRSLIKWELWKCRVEFEERAVYFTMARVLKGSYDDNRVMEFVLMKLAFPPEVPEPTIIAKPTFLPLTSFYTTGVVMNVFLLDPPRRLLSAFVWLASSNTIGLYVLLDWDKDEYIYVDTGVGCLISSNWSCILHDNQIVIHSEEADAAYQHFYPLSALRSYSRPRNGALKLSSFIRRHHLPSISARSPPVKSVSKKFVFPRIETQNVLSSSSSSSASASAMQLLAIAVAQHSTSPVPAVQPPEPAPNPYSFPPWYPESAHFVRQWWPTLPGVPRLSCTVVLLARHYPETHHTQFVLAQHYFKVPITGSTDTDRPSSDSSTEDDEDDGDEMLHLWYVSTPFEVVCVLDSPADNEDEDAGDRPRPLVAVDFGHAVWGGTIFDPRRHRVPKCLRFVTFPPVYTAYDRRRGKGRTSDSGGRAREEAVVRTLEIPEELDLDGVETINIDQSQGAVILSVKEGKIFILRYE
ncbi:hypothetical protein F5J12DRAFT_726130 [Pisolithus orientalis]|uniref:uncharacterized protein n=1 Tax=Pisolithus orientalis TaxID=936130 RepID=UPI00222548FC|nr:uncharacterized protein F5J12DRAFT_726130 [Pisolithus orientalis]KAI5995307.1 hypothetical protein F5J12DRAFT_726130 [Pisolithus orientalis]